MMKREWKEAAAAVVMGLLVPYILLNAAALWFQKPDPYICYQLCFINI